MDEVILSGVYKYVYEGKIIYVGKSQNSVLDCIISHSTEERFRPYIGKAEVFYFSCKDVAAINLYETVLINKYRPVLNISMMSEKPIAVDIKEPEWRNINELMEQKEIMQAEKGTGLRIGRMEALRMNERNVSITPPVKIDCQYLNLCMAVDRIVAAGRFSSGEAVRIPRFQDGGGVTDMEISMCSADDENADFSGITQYDIDVMDSIYTLIRHSYTSFSFETLIRIMIGNEQWKITSQKIKRAKASVDKLTRMSVSISHTDSGGRSAAFSGNLISVKPITAVSFNCRPTDGIFVMETPVLYQYAETISRITELPNYILENNSGLAAVDDGVMIRRYLVRRIECQKDILPDARRVDIIYEENNRNGLFSYIGHKRSDFSSWRKKTSMLRRHVNASLNALVDCRYVEGYIPLRKGQEYYGVKVNIQ